MQDNRRRYPRVHVQKADAEVIRALGAHVIWPNLEKSDILDLAYKGCAARRPGLQTLNNDQKMNIKIELGGVPAFGVSARVAWVKTDWIGIEFLELSPIGKLTLQGFLAAKLLGSSLKPVEKVFFGAESSFHHWFQGANDTHVFVWLDTVGRVEKVNVNREGYVVEIPRGGRFRNPTAVQREALLMLSHMDKASLPMEEFVRSFIED